MLLNTDLHGQVRGWEGRVGPRVAGWGVPTVLVSTTTEHWEEHELPGIHQQPEWPAGWWELPQGAAEGVTPTRAWLCLNGLEGLSLFSGGTEASAGVC